MGVTESMNREETRSSLSTTQSDEGEVDSKILLENLERFKGNCLNHAMLCWVALPTYVLIQAFIPFAAPTCNRGLSNVCLLALGFLVAHYVHVERKGWIAVKGVLNKPEAVIMRHLGVFKMRRVQFVLGFLIMLDMYTDIIFPFYARSCDVDITPLWQRAWMRVPVIGPFFAFCAGVFRFWGSALLCILVHLALDGGIGIYHLLHQAEFEYTGNFGSAPKVPSETYYAVARSASTGLIPSVALLCREMASQKRFALNTGADTLKAMQARQNEMLGLVTAVSDTETQLYNQEVMEKAEREETSQLVQGLILKVLLGHAPMLWLQACFFQVAYDKLELEAKIKLLLSMVLSTIVSLTRCYTFSARASHTFLFVLLPTLFLILWAVVKVYAAISCESHVWNLTTGCADMSKD